MVAFQFINAAGDGVDGVVLATYRLVVRHSILYRHYHIRQRYTIQHIFCTILIHILLIAFYIKGIRVTHNEERITVGVSHRIVGDMMNIVDMHRTELIFYVYRIDTERAVLMSALLHKERGFGMIGLNELGVIVIISRPIVTTRHRVFPALQRVGKVYSHRILQYLCIQIRRFGHMNIADKIVQRRQHSGELTRCRVGLDIESFALIRIAKSTPSLTADGTRVGRSDCDNRRIRLILHNRSFGRQYSIDEVIGVVDIAWHECQRSHTDIVLTQSEADRFGLFYITTCHTTGEIDECGIIESQILHLAVEVNRHTCLSRIASVVNKLMSLFLDLDEMFSDRHADGILAVSIGLYRFAVLGTYLTVDIERTALNRIVRSGVIDRAADRERGDIVKVSTVMHERIGTHITQLLRRIERVYAERRYDGIRRSFAGERYTTDDIITH